MTGFVIVVLVVLVMVIMAVLAPTLGTPEPYCSRGCTGTAWCRAFPNADKKQIRGFLQTFVDAFMFSETDRLRFLPNDAVMDIYKKATGQPLYDDMELEFFASGLQAQFGFDVEPFWHDRITLGEIFLHVIEAVSNSRQK